jgi:mRNA interferase RelE/StbE
LARLVLARRVRRELLGLNWPLTDAIENALGLLEREPQAGHALRGKLRGLYSLRVGAYRIIYQLTDNGQTVRVVAIRHRSIAYGGDPR